MDFNFNNNKLTLYFGIKLDSDNALKTQEEIEDILKDLIIDDLILDFEKLEYISSAGLRVVLKLAKMYPDHISIINTNLEVNNILHMTGFSEFIPTSKALRKISIDGCKLIAEGGVGKVYRLNADTIVKVFKYDLSMDDIQREIKTARKAFIYGIPTAISYDIVKVDDKYGLVFELIDCASICDHMINEPESFDKYVKIYASLFKFIHNLDATGSNLPSAKLRFLERIEQIKSLISIESYNKLKTLFSQINESTYLIHGDCHIKNILVKDETPIIIDMDTVCLGDKIFDLMPLYSSVYLYYEFEDAIDNNMDFFGISHVKMANIFEYLLKETYPINYKDDYEALMDKIRLGACVIYIHNQLEFFGTCMDKINKASKCLDSLLEKYDSVLILE